MYNSNKFFIYFGSTNGSNLSFDTNGIKRNFIEIC